MRDTDDVRCSKARSSVARSCSSRRWHRSWPDPASARGFSSRRWAHVVGIAGLAARLVAAFGIDRAGHNGTPALADFAVVMGIGALSGLAGLAFLRRVPSPRRQRARVEPISLCETNLARFADFVARDEKR